MGEYQFSSSVRFLPWIGKNFHRHPGWPGRILIMGEAHYADDDAERNLTRCVIQRQWQGERYAYFTRILRVLTSSNDTIDDRDREVFWSTVAFYEYVQRIVSGNARVVPSQSHWNEAHDVLPEVLEALRPDYVIVTGKRLWERLPEWSYGDPLSHRGKPWDMCEGRLESGHRFLSTFIYHPSSGGHFGGSERWRGLIRQLLRRKSERSRAG